MEFLFGIVVLVLDIWAIIKVLQSGADTGTKILWVVVIALLPLIGLILWYFLGPKGSAAIR